MYLSDYSLPALTEKSVRGSKGSVEGPSALSITRITVVAAILEGEFRAIGDDAQAVFGMPGKKPLDKVRD